MSPRGPIRTIPMKGSGPLEQWKFFTQLVDELALFYLGYISFIVVISPALSFFLCPRDFPDFLKDSPAGNFISIRGLRFTDFPTLPSSPRLNILAVPFASFSKNKNAFTSVILMTTMAKMFLAILIIVIYVKVFEPDSRMFVFPFLGIYLIYTIFETYFMMKANQGVSRSPLVIGKHVEYPSY